MGNDAIYIVDDICDGCGACEEVCAYEAISLIEGTAQINYDNCILCMMCIKACPVRAIRLRGIKKDGNIKNYRDVWVFVEYSNGKINPGCLQILNKGYELARELDQEVNAVVVGNSLVDEIGLKTELNIYGADSINFLQCKELHVYHAEDVAEILAREILLKKPGIVLFLGSPFGRVLAPRVACKVKAGLTADCTDLYIDDEMKLVQVRPTYGGKILASIVCPYDRPQMASVRPNIFESRRINAKSRNVPLTSHEVDIESVEKMKRIVKTFQDKDRRMNIDEAEVIVCGGFGVGSKDGFQILEELANKLGGAVAGTRTAVDQGWIDFSHQIGQTGKSIRPRLYIGCGVSGAIHHLIGMKNSKMIIAINTDPKAPIFKVADIGVVADLYEVIPKLVENL